MVTKPDLLRIWAAGALAADVQDPDDVVPGKFNTGWGAEIPPYEFFNFLQQLFTQGLAHINERGIAEWDTDTPYLGGRSYVTGSDGNIYVAVIDNTGVDPVGDDGTNWIELLNKTDRIVYDSAVFEPSVSDGDAIYWDSANSRYDRAIADGTDKQKIVGFADVTNSLVEAFGRSSLFSGLTAGSKYYLSGITPGAITATAPSEKVSVGLAKSASVMFVDIDPVAGTPIQDQTTWNTGTDTTESLISPDKLDAKIKTLAIGEGQTWQDVTGSRSLGVTYTNSTGKTIALFLTYDNVGQIDFYIDGNQHGYALETAAGVQLSTTLLVPDGSTYMVDTTATPVRLSWSELR